MTDRVRLLVVTTSVAAAAIALESPARAGGAQNMRFEVVEQSGIDHRPAYGGPDKGYISEFGGSGGVFTDIDGDGRVDAFLVNALEGPADDPVGASRAGLAGEAVRGTGHGFYRGVEHGFVSAPPAAGIGDRVWGNGAAAGDIDNDGHVDLFVTAIGPDRLYRNNGDGTFSALRAGIEDPGWGTSATFVDWDLDGWLDLYVARYVEFDAASTPTLGDRLCFYRGVEVFCGPEGLAGSADLFFRNRGDGSFELLSAVDPEATYGFALVSTDCDADGRAEIYVANDSTINLLYAGDGEGTIEDRALFSGAGYSADGREQAGMGATAADYDEDGRFDVFVTNFQNDNNALYHNLGDCSFEEVSQPLGLGASSFAYMGWAAHFGDFDGDADQDLLVVNGHIYPQLDDVEPYAQRNLLYRNLLSESGTARFEDVAAEAGSAFGVAAASRAAMLADHDDDGDRDVLVTNVDGAPTLLRNDGTMALPAITLTLVGRQANRSAHGARVIVRSGGRILHHELRGSDGYLSANDERLLLYLPGGVADEIEVRWPGGGVSRVNAVEPGLVVLDEERGIVALRSR